MAIGAADQIVVAGSSQFGTTDHDFAVARLNANGTLDTSFNGDGRATVRFDQGGGLNDRATGVAIDGSGRVVLGGLAQYGNTDYDFALARLQGGPADIPPP